MEQKKKYRYIFLGIAGCILLYWALNQTHQLVGYLKAILNMLSPFITGAALAFVLNVPMRAMERWFKGVKKQGMRRALSLTLTFLAMGMVVTGVILLLIPQINNTIESLKETIPSFTTRAIEAVQNYLDSNPDVRDWLYEYTALNDLDWGALAQKLMNVFNIDVSSVVEGATSAVVGLGTGLFNAVLSLVFCIYGLARKEILARQGRRLLYSILPEKASDETIRILRMTNSTFSNFISGQCLEALILSAMFAVTMTIFGMPYVPLVSVIIAVTALIPIVGAFVGCAIGAVFILVVSPVQAVWFVVLFLILQQIENNLIYPRVVGSSIGLPGMWVLVAVAVGGDMMGVAGMLIMIPLASVVYALLREFTQKRLAKLDIAPEKLNEQPPILKSGFREKREIKKSKREQKAAKQANVSADEQTENESSDTM